MNFNIPNQVNEYVIKLRSPGNINKNVKKIGDQIMIKIQEEYINNPANNKDNIKAQIKKDLLRVYYDEQNKKKVKSDIHQQICGGWYAALNTRISEVMKDAVTLLNNNDNINSQQGGGFPFDLLNKNPISELSVKPEIDASSFVKKNPLLPTADQATSDSEEEKKEETDKKTNEILFKEFIKYKQKLVEKKLTIPQWSLSATVSDFYKVQTNIISKTICNYALIERENLMNKIREIILGKDAIEMLKEYKISKRWLPKKKGESSSGNSIYSSFLTKLEKLSDPTNTTKSSSITRSDQKGGNPDPTVEEIPKYIPSTYEWKKIEEYVESQIKLKINEKIYDGNEIPDAIKEGFKEVFLQANCDCLVMTDKNGSMVKYLNIEYKNTLDYLCINIPDNYAAKILQSYLLRNFKDVSAYFNRFINTDKFFGMSKLFEDYVFGYNSLPPIFFSNEKIVPIYPQIRIDNNIQKDSKIDNLDECCDERKGDDGLDSSGISEYMKIKNINKQSSMFDHITPAVLTAVFDIYKTEFNKCTDDEKFLEQLFNMYSGRSVRFLKQIKSQFDNEFVDDYIERYILTKHPYTTKVISECIKHLAKIKDDIVKKSEDNSDILDSLSKYAIFLMYSASVFEQLDVKKKDNDFIDELKITLDKFFESVLPLINGNSAVNAAVNAENEITNRIKNDIIDKVFPKNLYVESLKTVFSKNSTRIAKARKMLKKTLIPMMRGYTMKNRKKEQGTDDVINPLQDSSQGSSQPVSLSQGSSQDSSQQVSSQPVSLSQVSLSQVSSTQSSSQPGSLSQDLSQQDSSPQVSSTQSPLSPPDGLSVRQYEKTIGIDTNGDSEYMHIGDILPTKFMNLVENSNQRPNLTKIYEKSVSLDTYKNIIDIIQEKQQNIITTRLNNKNNILTVVNGNKLNLTHKQEPKQMYHNFALDCFKCVVVSGNGNCLLNAVAWWVINYNTIDPSIFGNFVNIVGNFVDIVGNFVDTTKRNTFKNKKLHNDINSINVLELFGSEILDENSKYVDDGKQYITEYNIETGIATFGKTGPPKNNLIECTLLAEHIRKEVLCEFVKKINERKYQFNSYNNDTDGKYENWFVNLSNSLHSLHVTLNQNNSGDFSNDINTKICNTASYMDDSYIQLLCFIFQINIIFILETIHDLTTSKDINNILTYADYEGRPTIFIFRKSGHAPHYDVLYPCHQDFADCIKPLPVFNETNE